MSADRRGRYLWVALLVACVLGLLELSGCARLIDGRPVTPPVHVVGAAGSGFDLEAEQSLADVMAFWRQTYPKIARGASLPPLRGKLYSVDGDTVVHTEQVPSYATANRCLEQRPGFIVDNAAYCRLDDSIIWDRAPDHLVPVLARAYGPALTALVFAHEFGHAIQHRLGLDKVAPKVIDLESQADCAAGAFAAYALAGRTKYVTVTPQSLDRALEGYFQVRDSTPDSSESISHGNGFDRLNAIQNGIANGAKYCFAKDYYQHLTYTERGYVTDQDYLQGGNLPLTELVKPSVLPQDLNRFWTAAGRTIDKTFHPVQLKQAAGPECGSSMTFGYCAQDNTVYYTAGFARRAYYSITEADINKVTAVVRLVRHQPGDYALGQLIAMAWGMSARHQFFDLSTDDAAGLLAATCYSGAYAENINRATGDKQHPYVLSPPDMDEATSAVLGLVDGAFGARGTTGLQRIRAFVKGYNGGLHAC